MLTKVVIHRFRSCEDVTLDGLGPILVLVGRNGVGKTNILRAIQWAAESALNDGPIGLEAFFERAGVTLEFALGDRTYRYSIRAQFHQESRHPNLVSGLLSLTESIHARTSRRDWESIATRDASEVHLPGREPLRISPQAPFLPHLLSYLPPEEEAAVRPLREVAEFLGSIRYYPLDEPNEPADGSKPISEEEYRGWEARREVTGDPGEAVLLKLIQLSTAEPERFDEIRSLLGEDGLNLIRDIRFDRWKLPSGGSPETSWDYSIVRFYPVVGAANQSGLPYSALSLGTRRIIRLVVALIFDRSSVMLIEHPEDGIHRGMVGQVFGLLRGYTDPGQVIVSSHSTVVFDLLEPEEIRLVRMEEGTTRVQALTAEEAEEARRYIDEQGRFSDYLKLLHDV